jgi:hypothetical protein
LPEIATEKKGKIIKDFMIAPARKRKSQVFLILAFLIGEYL